MRSIHYLAPSTVEGAVAILAEHGARARMLAGGTDLIIQVRDSLREPDVFVDAKKISALTEVAIASDGSLTIGAAVPCYRIYGDDRIKDRFPALVDSALIIGGIAIQSRASLGGNLCNAGPAGDSIPPLIAHRASCNIAGPTGRRTVAVERFCTAPGRNVLLDGELLVSLSFPAPSPRSGSAYLRFIPREEMDIAVVGVAAQVSLDGDRFAAARIALGAVAPTPLFIADAGDSLVGQLVDETAIARAAELAQAASRPISDMRGTTEHRRHLVGVLTRRALARAVERARS